MSWLGTLTEVIEMLQPHCKQIRCSSPQPRQAGHLFALFALVTSACVALKQPTDKTPPTPPVSDAGKHDAAEASMPGSMDGSPAANLEAGMDTDTGTVDSSMRHAFEVRATEPAADTELDDVHGAISITFTSTPQLSSIKNGGVSVERDGRQVLGSFTLDGDIVRFTPETSWILSARYHVRLSSAIKDVQQRTLKETSFDFPVRAGRWTTMRVAGIDATEHPPFTAPRITLRRDGTGVLTWSGHDSPKYPKTVLSRFLEDRSWSTLREFDSGGLVGLGTNAAGHIAFAVNTSSPQGNPDELYRYTGDWTTDILTDQTLTLDNMMYTVSRVRDLFLDEDGHVYIVRAGSSVNDSYLFLQTGSIENGLAGDPYAIDNTQGAREPKIVPYDYSYLGVWLRYTADDAPITLWSNASTASCSSCVPNMISHPDVEVTSPVLRADLLQHSAIVIWQQSEQPWTAIWAARRAENMQWSASARISDGRGAGSNPDLALDEHGAAIAVWLQTDGSAHHVLSARFDATTGKWSPAESLSGSAELVAWSPAIAVEPHGNAIATWLQVRDDQVAELRWARYVTGTGWQREPNAVASPQRATSGNPYGQSASVAMDAAGRAIVAWNESGEIWVGRYE